jgi:hypothetical protein
MILSLIKLELDSVGMIWKGEDLCWLQFRETGLPAGLHALTQVGLWCTPG